MANRCTVTVSSANFNKGNSEGSTVPYFGSSSLCLLGTLIQIWNPFISSPAGVAPPSACSTAHTDPLHAWSSKGLGIVHRISMTTNPIFHIRTNIHSFVRMPTYWKFIRISFHTSGFHGKIITHQEGVGIKFIKSIRKALFHRKASISPRVGSFGHEVDFSIRLIEWCFSSVLNPNFFQLHQTASFEFYVRSEVLRQRGNSLRSKKEMKILKLPTRLADLPCSVVRRGAFWNYWI